MNKATRESTFFVSRRVKNSRALRFDVTLMVFFSLLHNGSKDTIPPLISLIQGNIYASIYDLTSQFIQKDCTQVEIIYLSLVDVLFRA